MITKTGKKKERNNVSKIIYEFSKIIYEFSKKGTNKVSGDYITVSECLKFKHEFKILKDITEYTTWISKTMES